MNRGRRFDEKQEYQGSAGNPFKNSIRGNIKSNEQINSFLKSQEVYKLMQNNLGTSASPLASTSFRIPRKQSPERNTFNQSSNFRDTNPVIDSTNARNRFQNKNSKNNGSGYNKQPKNEIFSRRERNVPSFRRDEPSSSSFSNYSRKRSHDDARLDFAESSMPKYPSHNESMDKANNSWRAGEKPESINQYSSNNHFVSNPFDSQSGPQYAQQSIELFKMNLNTSTVAEETVRTKSQTGSFFPDASNPTPFERLPPGQQIPKNDDPQKYQPNDPDDTNRQEQIPKRPPRSEEAKLREAKRKSTSERFQRIERRKQKRLEKKTHRHRIGKHSQLEIRDISQPTGAIDETNASLLKKTIINVLKEAGLKTSNKKELLIFSGITYSNGKFLVTCGDYVSREFLSNALKQQTPWPGVQLQCLTVPNPERVVDVLIPRDISHISEFRSLCEEYHSQLDTRFWRLISCENNKADDRRLFTIGMDTTSIDIIQDEFNCVVPCGNTSFEFVLNSTDPGKDDPGREESGNDEPEERPEPEIN